MTCEVHQLIETKINNYKCINCDYSRSIIPKDCIVCDTCNRSVSDGNWIATCTSYYYKDHLYCETCHTKYQKTYPREAHELMMKILEHDDLSNTDLAKPMIMEFW